MKFFVSRQHYYYGGHYCVEVAAGGSNYAGSDMLVPDKYMQALGEGHETYDPREAVKWAGWIQDYWQTQVNQQAKEGEKPPTIYMVAGSGNGLATQLIGDDAEDAMSAEETRAWAEMVYQKLPKCDNCGDLIKETSLALDGDDSWSFCSDYCLEQYISRNDLQEVADDANN